MKTLIELYDDRPIENVLSSEVFRPERTVYLCPPEVYRDKTIQRKMQEYFRHRGLSTELVFVEASTYDSEKLLKTLHSVTSKYEDCTLDITGGTDAALFACGMLCAGADTSAFTYSFNKNRFYNIHGAPFAHEVVCRIRHKVEDCFLMAGGAVRDGRVDHQVLEKYLHQIDPFFQIYLTHKSAWTKLVEYMQHASQSQKNETAPLGVETVLPKKGDRGPEPETVRSYLKAVEKIGFIRDLQISGSNVSFVFADHQTRSWIRDIGSVLELYVYKVCLDLKLFDDVRTSVVVDWEGNFKNDAVTNEIDVMGSQGIIPVFISCKTSEIATEALNELAILRDRFGGKAARAAIVTTRYCRNVTRHRAAELGIEVMDMNDIKKKALGKHIRSLMRSQTQYSGKSGQNRSGQSRSKQNSKKQGGKHE